ncbi:uncharacterized protein LOC133788570 [Humulus lupulus]|uniref:uncharacterized protein LOC133788570 n=1 Tax=Humulus lupulus TaxID=3486 RepID=UPI002B410E61|nr:uncharacterized protein LOC133788570 [Humulus lupulus]
MSSTTIVSLLLLSSSLTLMLSIAMAQGRAPHGLANENPIAFSPSAYDFFHPTKQSKPNKERPCTEFSCSPLPMAAQIEATGEDQESKMVTPHSRQRSLGAGGIAGIVFGLAFAVLLAMSVYYVVVTRQDNTSRAKPAQPDA